MDGVEREVLRNLYWERIRRSKMGRKTKMGESVIPCMCLKCDNNRDHVVSPTCKRQHISIDENGVCDYIDLLKEVSNAKQTEE